jgi:tRNA(fMet)-specific endonuclease VapC
MGYLMDTNAVSAVLKQNRTVLGRAEEAERDQKEIFVSAITYYEIRRGLLAVNAARKTKIFEAFCEDHEILEIDRRIIPDRAAAIYAELKQQGEILEDSDILIAASALVHDLILVTDDRHFRRIPGLMIENWVRQTG